jgi:hypothetical protein
VPFCVCMYICMYVCTYVCMYEYIFIGSKEIAIFNTQINWRSAFIGNGNKQLHRYSLIGVNIDITSYGEKVIITSRNKQERD